jgi:hypothetical protein
MPDPVSRLTAALADRYRLEVGSGHAPTLLGVGGMATVSAADSRGSADVAEATGWPTQPGMASCGWCVC